MVRADGQKHAWVLDAHAHLKAEKISHDCSCAATQFVAELGKVIQVCLVQGVTHDLNVHLIQVLCNTTCFLTARHCWVLSVELCAELKPKLHSALQGACKGRLTLPRLSQGCRGCWHDAYRNRFLSVWQAYCLLAVQACTIQVLLRRMLTLAERETAQVTAKVQYNCKEHWGKHGICFNGTSHH